MKLLVIGSGPLIVNGMAGQTVICGLVEAASDKEHDITYVGLIPSGYNGDGDILFSSVREFRNIREDVCVFAPRHGGRLSSFKNFVDKTALHQFTHLSPMLEESYDAVFSFDSLAYSLAKRVTSQKRFTIIGDPPSERLRYLALTGVGWKNRLYCLALGWWEKRHFSNLIPPDTGIGMYGSRHAREWSAAFKRQVFDLRPGLPRTVTKREQENDQGQLTVSFGGTLPTTASQLAGSPLEKDILPALTAKLGNSFRLRVVGRESEIFSHLAERWTCIELRGRVPRFHTELQSADIFILPMKYPVGVRTRLCEAIQAGCFCVCDPSIIGNMPELQGNDFIEFASTGEEFADAISRYSNHTNREALSANAQRFFAEHYSASNATAPILNFFESNSNAPFSNE